jgi:hypothetical protein
MAKDFLNGPYLGFRFRTRDGIVDRPKFDCSPIDHLGKFSRH